MILVNCNKMSYSNYDKEFAKLVNEQLNCTGITENAVFPNLNEN